MIYCTFLPLPDNSTTSSEWISYDVFTRVTGVSWIRCAKNQYMSGLAFAIDPEIDAYVWWGRCTNLTAGYTKREGLCWTLSATLAQGSNGSVSVTGERVVIERIKIEYFDYLNSAFYHTRWSYDFCLVSDGTYSVCIYSDVQCMYIQ